MQCFSFVVSACMHSAASSYTDTYLFIKITSEMPIPHSLRKQCGTPWDIEEAKKYSTINCFLEHIM